MKKEFVKCEYCRADIPTETCKLAVYHTTINGKEYTFCCQKCAQRFQQRKKK